MSAALVNVVENLGRPRILVVGDLILDRYVWGDAERISQEAPVVLLRADRREERLGGAASVASMLAALEADVTLAGVLGDDAAGERCRELLDTFGIGHRCVLTDYSRPSTLKERYIGRAQQKHPQQMMRVDYEVRDPIAENLADRLTSALAERLDACDIVLVSDYDKGVCRPELLRRLIDACRARSLRVLVDPIRGGDYPSRYAGCSAMTPNRLEASQAAGMAIGDVATAIEAADRLRRDLDMEAGIVTLDKDGMALADRFGRRRHFPVRPRQVYDITGAGDMVLSVLGMVLAAGRDYPEAIQLANVAGGLEVERIGVATLTRREIVDDLCGRDAGLDRKILAPELLAAHLDDCRNQGKTIVFTNGCFDLLHAGHVRYLAEAKAQGDVLVVGLNSDSSVRRLGKGPNRPVNDERNRALVLSALAVVDHVCLFHEDTPLELIRLVRPHVLVKGADYRPEEVVGKDFVESLGGRLHLAQLVPGQSTSATITRIGADKTAA